MERIPFKDVDSADLVVDAVYSSGDLGNASDAPLPRMLQVNTMGGFRYRGTVSKPDFIVLTSSFADPDWPDSLDTTTGQVTYFGDNKAPGRALHETPRKGNLILRTLFNWLAMGEEGRKHIPPIFLFGTTGQRRDVRFLGLLVPGGTNIQVPEDLVAVWKSKSETRFQNYRAKFTVLDVATIKRAWVDDLLLGNWHGDNTPDAWLAWKKTGRAKPLLAERSRPFRTPAEQRPVHAEGTRMLDAICQHYAANPYGFEACAGQIARLMLPDIVALDFTRPSSDGGRDAIGLYRVGSGASSITMTFALEAKCYRPNNGVGVRELSRLISRLRHREFGILITTSYLDRQAYSELKTDGHPIIVVAGVDIVDLLHKNGTRTAADVTEWLASEFESYHFPDKR